MKTIKLKNKQKLLIITLFMITIIISTFLLLNKKQAITFIPKPTTIINQSFEPYKIIKSSDGKKDQIKVDQSKLKTDKVGTYPVVYRYLDKKYSVDVQVIDVNKPTFELQDIEVDAGMKVDPATLVTNLQDESKTKITFKKDYDFSKAGNLKVTVVVSDASNNQTSKNAKITILPKDKEKPIIAGLSDLSVALNGQIDYLAGVSVSDNHPQEIKIQVNDKKVDLTKIGDYSVTYSAKDRSGNKTTATRKVSVVEKKDIGVFEQTQDKIIYLTFDDGPSSNTQKILDILDRYNAKATFFVTGNNQAYNYLIKEAYKRGNTIGLHTYCHDYPKIYSSVEAYFNDLGQVGEMVKNEIGFVPHYIRFPGGASNTVSRKYCSGIMSTLSTEVINRGYQYYDWNCGTGDAGGNNVPVEQLFVTATSSNANNQVILAHDTEAKDTTVEVLPAIIEHYQALGYSFKGIDDNSYVPHHHVNN